MARASQRRSSKSRKAVTSMEVDFTGVEAGGRSMSNGWAHGRVKKAEWTTAKESRNAMVKVAWEAKRGKEKATVYDNLVNTENALWRFKQMLEAVGIEVPDGALDVDVTELVDLECDLLIENEDYEGKDQPRVVDYRAAGAGEIDEDEDKPKSKRKPKDAEEDEEEDDEEEAPKSKRRASKDKDEDEDEEEETPKSKRRSRAEPEDEDEEEDEPPKRKRSRDTEDEEEEDEKPSRKKKRTRDEEEEDEDDEEEDPPARKGSKLKIRDGSKVKFKDEDDKLTRGTVVEVDGDDVEVKTTKGDVYAMKMDELELA